MIRFHPAASLPQESNPVKKFDIDKSVRFSYRMAIRSA